LKECFVVKNVPSYVKDEIDIDVVSTSIEKFNGDAMVICKDLTRIPKNSCSDQNFYFLLFRLKLEFCVELSQLFKLMLVEISTDEEKKQFIAGCLYREQNPEILSYLLRFTDLHECNFDAFKFVKKKYDKDTAAIFLTFYYHRRSEDLTDYNKLFDKDPCTFTKFMFPVVYGLIDEKRTEDLIDRIFSLHPTVYGFLNEESLYALQYITNPKHLQIALLASARGNPDVLKLLLDRGVIVDADLLKQRYNESYHKHSKRGANGRVISDVVIRRRLERCNKILM